MDHLEAERRELHNKIVDMKGAVRVFCRQRPLAEDEAREGLQPATECDEEESSIVVFTGRYVLQFQLASVPALVSLWSLYS
jgi:hypothetical protein